MEYKDTICSSFLSSIERLIIQCEEITMENQSQWEDLPVEMIMEIFRYLSLQELYFSFSHLNLRLNRILKSLNHLLLQTTSHYDPVLSFFHSFTTIRIHFSNCNSSPLSKFHFSHLIQLQSFTICRSVYADKYLEPIEQLDQLLSPTRCPRLQSLRIPYCSQTFADWIFSGAFPHLKICHLYDTGYEKILLPSSTIHILPSLRQLTIQEREGDEFEMILHRCPNLTYLNFSCHCPWTSLILINTTYASLKRLHLSRLKQFLFHNGRFDRLLVCFPNLRHFDLTVDQCPQQDETIDFTRIGKCLEARLPHLITLEWRIYLTIRNRSSFYRHTFQQISQLHRLFHCFGRVAELLHIASFDFTSIYHYDRQFVRPSHVQI